MAPTDQLIELGLAGAGHLIRMQLFVLALQIAQDQLRVQPIGLGPPAQRAGVVRQVACVQHVHRTTGCNRSSHQQLMQIAGGFHTDRALLRQALQPTTDRPQAVVDLKHLCASLQCGIQCALRYVDAGKHRAFHDVFPSL
jgi:hypothetical protein